MIRAIVTGCGSYAPERVMTNKDFEAFLETNDDWIVQRTGIRQRHIAAEGETTADLGEKAARAALADAGRTPDDIDLIIIMTVNPGFGGQSFIAGMIPKIRRAKELVGGRCIEILVDGGVKAYNAGKIVEAGATILAAGSAVFNKKDSIENNIRKIREAVRRVL